MPKYADKIKAGQPVTDADWNRHLLESHQAAPGMTPAAFAPYRTSAGKTSYELLAASVEHLRGKPATVLDLACGDGFLFSYLLDILGPQGKVVGVDMSEGELAIAKSSFGTNARVRLLQGPAQSLPLADHSIDAIVCHMAFMLFLPLDAVVLELRRVLKVGGTFSAVIGNARGKAGLLGEILKRSMEVVCRYYPKLHEAPSGDSRVQSEAGLREIFSSGFGEPAIQDFSLLIRTDPQGVWNLMKEMYFVSMLQPPEKKELEIALKEFATSQLGADGTLAFEFQMRMFRVEKRPA